MPPIVDVAVVAITPQEERMKSNSEIIKLANLILAELIESQLDRTFSRDDFLLAHIACELKSGRPYEIVRQSPKAPVFQTPFYERVRDLAAELNATVEETELAAGDHGTLGNGWLDIDNEPGAPRKIVRLLITPRPAP
jgi:hypothetical protein